MTSRPRSVRKATVKRAYVTEGLSINQIARRHAVSRQYVDEVLTGYGVKRRPAKAEPARIVNGATRLLSLRMPHDMIAAYDKTAAEIGVDRTALIKAVLRLYLKERCDETVKRLVAQREFNKKQVDLFA